MSVYDDLTEIQRSVDELCRCIGRLETRVGSSGLDIRRVRTDVGHLRESVALLRASAPPEQPGTAALPMVQIPDAPYDSSL